MSDGVSVQVALRIRPLVESETSRGCVKCLETTPSEPQVLIRDLAFTYNHVFPPEVSQAEVYETAVKHMVLGLFKVCEDDISKTVVESDFSDSQNLYLYNRSLQQYSRGVYYINNNPVTKN